jgi:hypothetical protein
MRIRKFIALIAVACAATAVFASCVTPPLPGPTVTGDKLQVLPKAADAIPRTGDPAAAQLAQPVEDFFPLIVRSSTPTLPPPTGGAAVDHTSIAQFGQIPEQYLQEARALNVLFLHQSTGSRVDANGLNVLQKTSAKYDRSNWDWPEFNRDNSYDFPHKLQEFSTVANQQAGSYDVIGMKFCYIDWWFPDSEQQKFLDYRDEMLSIEARNPGKIIIWTTEALWSDDSAAGNDPKQGGVIQEFNKRVRDYALANNKVFFDLADIESHDTDGSPCYNGYEALCMAYADDTVSGHPNEAGSLRLAKGFWVLMAKVAGWRP